MHAIYHSRSVVTTADRIDPSTIGAFSSIEEPTSTISDVFDALGIRGAVAASRLQPTIQGARVVGQAVTVRNVPLSEPSMVAAQ
jgi:4-hydroxy-4-methyl-2-oxoglutarate aldolase